MQFTSGQIPSRLAAHNAAVAAGMIVECVGVVNVLGNLVRLPMSFFIEQISGKGNKVILYTSFRSRPVHTHQCAQCNTLLLVMNCVNESVENDLKSDKWGNILLFQRDWEEADAAGLVRKEDIVNEEDTIKTTYKEKVRMTTYGLIAYN